MQLALRCTAFAVAATVLASCVGVGDRPDPPPSPELSVTAETVGLARKSENGPCNSTVVTLDSGQSLTVFGSPVPDGCQNRATPFLLGDRKSWEPYSGVERLVLAGTLEGAAWVGAVRWHPQRKLWCVIFVAGEGAYWRGDGFHLASGLFLPAASDFHWLSIDRSDLLPLRNGDDLCLNERGEAAAAKVWTNY
jgi:hypothetical protein